MKLQECRRLRVAVEDKLELWWSPSQILRWLIRTYRDDEEMRVSHETIYQSLFVQGRGTLRKELWRSLRTGRAVRRPQGRAATITESAPVYAGYIAGIFAAVDLLLWRWLNRNARRLVMEAS
jgi:IS30 family transposase